MVVLCQLRVSHYGCHSRSTCTGAISSEADKYGRGQAVIIYNLLYLFLLEYG
jgi:hypothetical protein